MSAGFRIRRNRSHRLKQPVALFLEYYPAIVTIFVASVLAMMLVGTMQRRLYPLLRAAARTQTENQIIAVMERAVTQQLEQMELNYSDLVSLNRLPDGAITAVTTDMAAINRLRSALAGELLSKLSQIDRRDIAVPVGNLSKSELLWGRGPTIKIRAISLESPRAEFESEFIAGGLNQTLHQLWITLWVPASVLLPGEELEFNVQTRLCVAETVIIGEIPNVIQKANG